MNGVIRTALTEQPIDDYTDMIEMLDKTLVAYWGNRKTVSDDTEVISYLTNVCLQDNLYKWRGIIATTKLEYDPITNYDSTEHEVIDNKRISDSHNTDTLSMGKRKDTIEKTGKDTHMLTLDDTIIDGVAPSNKLDFVDTDRHKTDGTDTTVINYGTNDIHTQDDATDTTNRDDTSSDYSVVTRDLTRKGNIGVTTSQQMIQAERDIVNLHIIRDIAHEVANAITYAIY